MTPPYLERRDGLCTQCGQWKRPTRAYMALLKSRDLPYVCKACRESGPLPPMGLGKLGVLGQCPTPTKQTK